MYSVFILTSTGKWQVKYRNITQLELVLHWDIITTMTVMKDEYLQYVSSQVIYGSNFLFNGATNLTKLSKHKESTHPISYCDHVPSCFCRRTTDNKLHVTENKQRSSRPPFGWPVRNQHLISYTPWWYDKAMANIQQFSHTSALLRNALGRVSHHDLFHFSDGGTRIQTLKWHCSVFNSAV